MAIRGSKGTSSLFTPLYVVDVLIPNEVVQYNERLHWASLVPSFLETIAALILITLFAGGLPGGAFGGFLFIVATVIVFVMYRRERIRKAPLLGGIAALVIGFLVLGFQGLVIALILGAFSRFVYRFAMWAFYEKLYITNRRVIKSTGFLGANIDGMPLTRITDIAFNRSVPGELLGYGTFRLETAGQDQALGRIPFLNQPDLFYNILIGLSTTAQGSVKSPLNPEEMAESRATTIRPKTSRPVRVSLRRLFPGPRLNEADFGDGFLDDDLFDDGT